jgi:hypothetical protein
VSLAFTKESGGLFEVEVDRIFTFGYYKEIETKVRIINAVFPIRL